MPLALKYLGVEVFGVWATMLTLVSWITLFDLGIGNGLKNKVAESLASKGSVMAASYISTAYTVIGAVSLVLLFAFFVLYRWLPWQQIFNTEKVPASILQEAVFTLAFFVFVNFWVSLVGQIYQGLQKSSYVVAGQFGSNILALLLVFALSHLAESSLIYMVWAYGLALLTVNVILSLVLFLQQKELRPSLVAFDKEKMRSLLSLGVRFFIIQFSAVLIFMTDKVLISQLLGPAEVTPYEVLFKLFGLFTVLHSLILAPLWPAYSDAYTKGDMPWIQVQLRKQVLLVLPFFLAAAFVAWQGPLIVKLWMGNVLQIPHPTYVFFAVFISVSIWSNVFSYFVNAIGKTNVQTLTAIIAAGINIPLSILFVRCFGMGVEGIILASIVSVSIYALAGPLEVYQIVKGAKKWIS